MTIGKLYAVQYTPPDRYIRGAAALGGLEIERPPYKHYEDNKKPEFLSKFPRGKIPAFEGADGFLLTESQAIGRYISSLVPNAMLLGSNAHEAALVDQWFSFGVMDIGQHASYSIALVRGYVSPYNKPIHQIFVQNLIRSLRTLNNHLSTRTFLVTERITLADLAVAAFVQSAMTHTIDAELRKEIPHVIRHAETIANQPKLKDIYGEITYIDKALQYVPPPKEKKEAKAPEKKAEKAEKPVKQAEDEEEEEELAVEPKTKNPLDLLPKSSFNLEDWKRAYSNLDTRGPGGSLEWFYERFDKEGFSIWRVDYKYPEDLTLVFMSSNLVGGFFNRLEASRKYLFGSLGVLGTTNDSIISGVFILRGKDHMAVVECAPDWESYTFKPIDLENSEDKEFFEAALAWDLKISNKAWADGKNFK